MADRSAGLDLAAREEQIQQIPSYMLVNGQLQDLVRTQNTAIIKLQCMQSTEISRSSAKLFEIHLGNSNLKENKKAFYDIEKLKRRDVTVPYDEYQAVVAQLDEEKLQHVKTKAKLAEEMEKFQFAEGQIKMLKAQLEREKKTFENAFQKLKSKAIDEAQKNDELYNQCLEMEELCIVKDDGLNFQDSKIKDLRSRIAKQKQTHKQLVANLDIELKQEQYVARHLQELSNKTTKIAASKKKTTRG